ncbi:YicC family protein [Geobacter pelophilus]|uniref:YicC family protein n=1 Tax=Geoanaerobacter pelophilus TaxID=60036 RepID=A0AAW4KWL6_9BACT|nr:YicC/YloC family endoribonuclease [Geoanaerobacter pelophilus]MBT0663003.1 YicC family protein [Geoanaerobacter pelophilus]
MIKSMTGYGKAERETSAGRIIVEIRSVNHRYGEISVKMPRHFLAMEHEVRRQVLSRIKRGKIEVFVKHEMTGSVGAQPLLNIPLAKAYHKSFVSLQEALGLGDPITLALIAAQKDVLAGADDNLQIDELAGDLFAVVKGAVDSFDLMREKEGAALLEDITQRVSALESFMAAVAERAPAVVTENAARLKERVAQLLAGQPLDDARIAQEIALMADRCDITEELVRFKSHLAQFRSAFDSAEPVGRKLDFLLQELNREVNTVGSKANDAGIAAQVVALKSELEKIREQVQNIE